MRGERRGFPGPWLLRGTLGMALLSLLPALPLQAQRHELVPQAFKLFVRLHNGERVASTRVLRKGAILQPVDPAGDRYRLQPVVLCHALEVHFAEDGLSDPVEIEGFCYGPGLPAAKDKVEWWTTRWIDRRVARASGCSRELEVSVREQQTSVTLPLSGEVIDTCGDPLPACRERFRSVAKRQFDGKELRILEEHNACGVKLEGKWTLRCDRDRARAVSGIP
jgi:hypothetical protein